MVDMRPLLLGVLVLSACEAEPAAPPPPATTFAWNTAFDATTVGSLSGVWGSGPNDVFAVGGDEARALIYHFDGAQWAKMTVPDVPLLVWVFGFGPDDVYAVGLGGGAVHYDGAAWRRLDTGTTEALWGIFGLSRDQLWIVGGDPIVGEPVILRYDGNTFTPEVLDPAENPRGAKALFKVWGIGSKLFAVGADGLILERSADRWVRRPAGAMANEDFVSLWGNREDNIVAVGGRGNARVATYDGAAWTTSAPSGIGGLNAVFMTDEGTTHIGGVSGFAGTLDSTTGEVELEDTGTFVAIHAAWGDGLGRVYAVGGTFAAPHRGVALVRAPEAVR